MSFSFNPMSDEELNAIQNRGLLAEGVYPFIVRQIEQHQSKSGNLMLKVTIDVIAAPNDSRKIIDYITTTETMMFKLKHFCESLGIDDGYQRGNIIFSACINRSGKAKIGAQKGAQKEDGSFYPDKNVIKDYIGKTAQSKLEPLPKVDFNDDIGF